MEVHVAENYQICRQLVMNDRKHSRHIRCSSQSTVVTWLTKVLWKGLLSTFNCQGGKEKSGMKILSDQQLKE